MGSGVIGLALIMAAGALFLAGTVTADRLRRIPGRAPEELAWEGSEEGWTDGRTVRIRKDLLGTKLGEEILLHEKLHMKHRPPAFVIVLMNLRFLLLILAAIAFALFHARTPAAILLALSWTGEIGETLAFWRTRFLALRGAAEMALWCGATLHMIGL